MSEPYTYHLIHADDDYPPVLIRFAPGEDTERVMFSQPRYELVDEDDGNWVASFDDEDAAYEARDVKNREHGIDPKTDEPRFYVSDAYDNDTRPDWFHDGGFGAHWHRTDAWRGYSQVDYNDLWEPYAGGWVTGYPDDTTGYKMTAADLHNALWEGTIVPPFPVVWFFGVTSNVFSQSSDILIPAGKADEMDAWLETVDFDPEAVGHACN